MALALDHSQDFKVLRRFQPRLSYGPLVGDIFYGAVIDVEGTGLDQTREKIIQFAGIKFEFDRLGNIGRIVQQYVELQDPGQPLEPEVVEVTGLTDDALKGHKIDLAYVAKLFEGVSLCLAHNAEYDRQMCEREIPGIFESLAFGCSQKDVDWKRFDCQYIGLEYLLMKACGEFFTPHDALQDAGATLHILAKPRTKVSDEVVLTGSAEPRSPFQLLIESVREPTLRLSAWNSPFETKDVLRLRRFRWNPTARVWQKDLKQSQLAAERQWLMEHVYDGDLWNTDAAKVTRISPKDRYSVRA